MTDKKHFMLLLLCCVHDMSSRGFGIIKRGKESKYKGKRKTVLVPIVIDSHKMTKCSHQKSFVISLNTFCFSLKIFIVGEGKTDNSIIVIVIAS